MSAEQPTQPSQPTQPTQPGQSYQPSVPEAFVGQSDRPEFKLTLDTPLSELRVRDLSAILAQCLTEDRSRPKPTFDMQFDLVAVPKSTSSLSRIEDMIQEITGLREQVSKLSDQVQTLQQRDQ